MSISTTSGCVRVRLPDRVGAVDRLAHHVDVRLRVEQRAESGAQQRLVVGEQYLDHEGSRIGNVAVTTNPPDGPGPAVSVPPSATARARMPAMPLPDSPDLA